MICRGFVPMTEDEGRAAEKDPEACYREQLRRIDVGRVSDAEFAELSRQSAAAKRRRAG
jgi:hypothetical protein